MNFRLSNSYWTVGRNYPQSQSTVFFFTNLVFILANRIRSLGSGTRYWETQR